MEDIKGEIRSLDYSSYRCRVWVGEVSILST